MKVPFNDLGRAAREQQQVLDDAFARVRESGWFVMGPEHNGFETELAQYLGAPHVLGVGNGTDALELAMRGLHDGDARRRVLVAANAGAYAATAARAAGFEVAWCDIDPETHCVDPASVERHLDDDVFAVVVTHLYGRMAPVERVVEICGPRNVAVIEDCAQAIGARRDGRVAGSVGDVGTFSFYPTKNLGALGDGGALCCRDDALATRLRELRQYGWGARYRIDRAGGRNSRLDELQAAILRARLPLLEAGNERRREIIARYADAATDRVRVLPAADGSHVGHLAVVVTDDAADLARHLEEHGVATQVHYPIPDDQQPGAQAQDLPATHGLVGRILSLPCFPELTDDEIDQVCRGLSSY